MFVNWPKYPIFWFSSLRFLLHANVKPNDKSLEEYLTILYLFST
jgi:hypothetical protein